jgi:tRNA A-37 threonylcarbamoyl transferase component Bud32
VSEAVPPRLVADRYLLLRVLGKGGMGTVWLADDQLIARRVAVKELRPPQGLPAVERQVVARRAVQEARSAGRVRHPGAVTLYDVIPATADDAVYLIMELIEGPTLSQLIRSQGKLPDAAVARYGLQLLDVLAAAHALGIVHRDVKPSNIMITPSGQVKLTDFGIAHILGDARITTSGVMGTQAYMAPELFEAQAITPAADLWALGATLYAAACGYGPFDRDNTAATLRAILLDSLPVPRCGPAIAAAITGLLQRDPAVRATIEAARAWLRQATPGTAVPPPRTAPAEAAPPPARQASGGRSAGGQPVPGQRPSREPATPAVPTLPPTPPPTPTDQPAPEQPARARVRRPRLLIGLAAAIVIAVGTTVGFLATRLGPASAGQAAEFTMAVPGSVSQIAFSPDGTLLAANDTRGPGTLWDASDGAKVATLPSYPGTNTPDPSDYFVAFSPASETVAFPDSGFGVELWDVASHSSIASLDTTGTVADDVAFSPDGKTVAVAGFNTVQLWDAGTRKVLSRLTASGSKLTVAFSPNGTLLAVGEASTGMVDVYDLSRRAVIATLSAPFPGSIGSYGWGAPWFAFAPDSGTLAVAGPSVAPTGSADGVRLWNVASRTWGATLTDPGSQGVGEIAFSPDGRTLAVPDGNENVYLWDTATGKVAATKSAGVLASVAAFSPDGKTLAIGGTGQISLWNVTGG